jgi:hypothetical protein
VAATRPLSALISAALLLLTMVAGVGGVGGFAGLGPASAAPRAQAAAAPSTVAAAASTIGTPVTGERRAAPALGTASSKKHTAGWAPNDPESAELPAAGWQSPVGLVDAAVSAPPAVLALTIQVSHRGRAPPVGSLFS